MSLETTIDRTSRDCAEFRHRLHQIPEVMFEEFQTAAAIRAELDRLGIKYVAGVENAPTATVAWLGDTSKPCIALRADIDALPIEEKTGLPYASKNPGKMHACGHDGHTATLMGVASIIKSIQAELPVCVKLLWQPAEEGGGGAERMVKAGVLDGRIGPKAEAIFGLHGWPGLKVGTVATKPGVLLAATDSFKITFTGRGCHGAFPHLGRDPIVAAAEAVLNLQQFISRELDPLDSAVITVGQFNAGTTTNVIPDSAVFEGTARTLTPQTRKQIQSAMIRRCKGIAQANECEVTVEFSQGYPPTVNDPKCAEYVAQIARKAIGPDRYIPVGLPCMGGEDFAYYLEKVPGCFFLIGVEPKDHPGYPPLHNDRFDFTDASLAVGMRMFLELVMNWGK